LNISSPSLILDEEKAEYRKVGTHRRMRFDTLMHYKRRADAELRVASDQLATYDLELAN
jgi:hypothetical protein